LFTISGNATDTGSGAEDFDVAFKAMVAGSLYTFLNFDADGVLTLGYGGQTTNMAAVTVGTAGSVAGNLALNDAGVLTLYDDGNNTSVAIGPVADGTTTLGITGSLDISGSVDAGTLTIGSGSITDSSGAISFGNENLSTTGTLTATTSRLAQITTSTKTDNYVVTTADLGSSLRMNSSSDKTFTLPSVGTSEDGARITFIKVGSGKMTLDAADSDYIYDSAAGATIYTTSSYATITIEYCDTDTRWYIISAVGTWTTT
jgi:hypothetical protein